MNNITAVVLAGGFGRRIQHLLQELPKPMAPVLGLPFVEWVVRFLAKQGITEVIISTGYLAEKIEAHFRSAEVPGIRLQCVAETEPMGTAGGFLQAARRSHHEADGWLVLNGDSLVLTALAPFVACLNDPAKHGALVGIPMADASRYGTLITDPHERLTGFAEKKSGAGLINAGVYLLEQSLLARFPAKKPLSFEQDVFPSLIAQGVNLQVYKTEAAFLDIGTPESLPMAERFIAANQEWFQAAPN